MNRKFCDICGAEEGSFGSCFTLTGFNNPPKGIKEACPTCHAIISRVEDRLAEYFEKLQSEMMKDLIEQTKMANKKRGLKYYWPAEDNSERIIRIRDCYDCPHYKTGFYCHEGCHEGKEAKLFRGIPSYIPKECPLEYYNKQEREREEDE